MTRRRRRLMAALLLVVAAGTAIGADALHAPDPEADARVGLVAQPRPAALSRVSAPAATPHPGECDTSPDADPPTLSDDSPRDMDGLPNVVAYHDSFVCGGAPEGDAGFETLTSMGIRTIISVDGAAPDVDLARAHGLRYIHLPIGYNGFDKQREAELVRAARDAMLDGPVYIHCHHGKHRAAGAAATIAVALGWMTPDEGVARMKVSGTSPAYHGLYACAQDAKPLSPDEIDAVPADFPEVSRPRGLVAAMVEIDEVFDHLKEIEAAGWRVPDNHPDLVPVAEAGRLADLFRLAREDPRAMERPADFAAAMLADSERAQAIEDRLAAIGDGSAGAGRATPEDRERLSADLASLAASCRQCHAAYRD